MTLSPLADGRGPCSLNTAQSRLPGGLRPGEPVLLTDRLLQMGAVALEIPEGAPYDLPRGRLRIVPGRCRQLIGQLWERWRAESAARDRDRVSACTTARLREGCRVLTDAFLRGDRDGVVETGRGLLGLGQGLTPSGDDVLAGLFLVLGMEGSPFSGADALLGTLLEGQRARTTDVSWQMLTAAANGDYKESLVEFARACGGGDGEFPAGADKVFAIGHSSGRDLVLGCLTAYGIILRSLNQQEG